MTIEQMIADWFMKSYPAQIEEVAKTYRYTDRAAASLIVKDRFMAGYNLNPTTGPLIALLHEMRDHVDWIEVADIITVSE